MQDHIVSTISHGESTIITGNLLQFAIDSMVLTVIRKELLDMGIKLAKSGKRLWIG